MPFTDGISFVLRGLPERWPVPIPTPIAALVVVSLTLTINTWVALDKGRDITTENEYLRRRPSRSKLCRGDLFRNTSFDYIIVGAGTAGMVLATRIANYSEDASILLLEAGGEPSTLNALPIAAFPLFYQEGNNWIYNTTPQENACFSCDGGKMVTTRGKMLGGSTSSNLMMYVRGNRKDYDRWSTEDLGGDPQWTYSALLPYFKKSEDYNGFHKDAPDVDKYHRRGGLLNVGSYDYSPGGQQFLSAAKEKGYLIGDYNGAKQEVFSPIDVTIQDGCRESTYRAFYKDTGKPPNLCIRKYAHVIKIDFDDKEEKRKSKARPRGTGVTYVRHGRTTKVQASREVILSAGVFGSPKLLLLSGIGPKEDLQALNIPVVKELPVGRNLQDHVFTFVGPFLMSPSFNPHTDVTIQAGVKFLLNRTGPIAAPVPLTGFGYLKSPYAQPSYSDLQILQLSVALFPELPMGLNRALGFSEEVIENWLEPYLKKNTDARFPLICLSRPKSKGYLKLSSSNPEDNPILNPNYLKNPDDVEALLYGFKKVVELYEGTDALNHTKLFPKPFPPCETFEFKSDSYYRCVIRHLSASFYHHVGTCAMGKVVDKNLRVKGIDGLRVIDASVIPRTPNGNTQAPTIAAAEKGADLIVRGDNYWKNNMMESKSKEKKKTEKSQSWHGRQ